MCCYLNAHFQGHTFNYLAISNDVFSLLQCKKYDAKSEKKKKKLEMQVSNRDTRFNDITTVTCKIPDITGNIFISQFLIET